MLTENLAREMQWKYNDKMKSCILFCLMLLPSVTVNAQPSSPRAVVLIQRGETSEVTIAGECRRLTNNARIAIGIETGPQAVWPQALDGRDPNFSVTRCK